jgi:hypothetical protein
MPFDDFGKRLECRLPCGLLKRLASISCGFTILLASTCCGLGIAFRYYFNRPLAQWIITLIAAPQPESENESSPNVATVARALAEQLDSAGHDYALGKAIALGYWGRRAIRLHHVGWLCWDRKKRGQAKLPIKPIARLSAHRYLHHVE